MKFKVGELARLVISEALESHHYKNGDLVRVEAVYNDENTFNHVTFSRVPVYRVRLVKSNRDLHWYPMESQLKKISPLEYLANALDED